jgi:AcrR family transcriptional regulator
LIDTTIDLVAEHGVQGFSMAEASRRLGVAVAAPYLHFADRDALLAAVAVRAEQALGQRLARVGREQDPAQRLVAAVRRYVRFSAEERPLFQTLVFSGLDKTRYPNLLLAAREIGAFFIEPATQLTVDDPQVSGELASAVLATAHGYAVLLLDGTFGIGPAAANIAVEQAAAATRALIAGRDAFTKTGDI